MKWPEETPAVAALTVAPGVALAISYGVPWYWGAGIGLIIMALVLGLWLIVDPWINGRRSDTSRDR